MFGRSLFTAALLLALAGCASLPEDQGRSQAEALGAERGLPVEAEAQALTGQLLAEPVGPGEAVRLALLNEPGLRAAYARLGLSAADVYRAGRLANPTLSASRLDSDEPGALDQVTFGLSQSFTELVTLTDRSRLAKAEFARARAEVAALAFTTAADATEAWHRYAAAVEIVRVRGVSAELAEIEAELAQRFFDAGNISRLDLAQHRAAAADARLAAVTARRDAERARAELAQVMGLDADMAWRIRDGLPAVPDQDPGISGLAAESRRARLDMVAAERRVEALEQALGMTRRWRWLGELEIELERERESDGERLAGAGLSVELPVFHQHQDDVVRAEARLQAAYAERNAVAARVGRELGLAEAGLGAAREHLAAYADGLPEHRRRVEELQKRVDYMLAGVFELIEARQSEYHAAAGYLGAVRDYWLARVDLERAAGTLIDTPPGPGRVRAEDLIEGTPEEPDDKDHHRHHGGHR